MAVPATSLSCTGLIYRCFPGASQLGESEGRSMGNRIGKRFVDGLAVNGKEYFAWDDDLPGFGVRVRTSCAKA